MDYSFLDFVLGLGLLVATTPFAYLTWASGTFDLLVAQARKRKWLNIPPPTENGEAAKEWDEQFH